ELESQLERQRHTIAKMAQDSPGLGFDPADLLASPTLDDRPPDGRLVVVGKRSRDVERQVEALRWPLPNGTKRARTPSCSRGTAPIPKNGSRDARSSDPNNPDTRGCPLCSRRRPQGSRL